MSALLEKSLQRDLDLIRGKVIEMGNRADEALQQSLTALQTDSRHSAYSVILRDRYIDELEKELDRLCLEFIVRQQPAAGHLRFVYAAIKINNELERIGDYAESVARHYLALCELGIKVPFDKLIDIANHSVPMLRNALLSFINQDAELARETRKLERKVDELRSQTYDYLAQMRDKKKLPVKALSSLMIIASRYERVADQANNICEEVLYMMTGENIKHQGTEVIRILFVDENDACRGQMAVGIANELELNGYVFNSAGVAPRNIDSKTVDFMMSKGIDISHQKSKFLNQILNLDHYEIIISLTREADVAFPGPPTKTVGIRWHIDNPIKAEGTAEEIQAAFEKTYQYLENHIEDLVRAIKGEHINEEKRK